MGYMSDVAVLTTREGWEQIKQAMHKANPEHCEYYLNEGSVRLYAAEKYVVFKLEQVKWYTDDPEYYPCVDAFMEAVAGFDDQRIPYELVIVGENKDDVVHKYGEANYDDGVSHFPTLEVRREIIVEN